MLPPRSSSVSPCPASSPKTERPAPLRHPPCEHRHHPCPAPPRCADALAPARRSARSRWPQAHLDRIAAVDGDVHAFLHVDRDGALAAARGVDRAPGRRRGAARPRRRADRRQGRHGHQGPADHLRLEDPRGLDPALRRHAGQPAARGRHADPRQDQHGRVRHGLLHRALGLRPDPQPLGPRRGSPAAPAAAPRQRWRPSRRRWRSAPTPAARSASPPPSPARSGTKPTYGGVSRYGLVALASSLDQAGPCSRTVLDAALLHSVIGGHDPMDSTSINAPAPPVVEAARRARRQGHAHRRRQGARRRGLPAGCPRPVRGVGRSCSWTPAPRSSRCPARASTTRSRPTT